MKNRVSAKVSNSFLALTICSLTFCTLAGVKAQSRSASINLEGTEWEGAPISYAVGSAMGTLQCFYVFEDKGKAIYKCLAIQSPGTMAGSNLNNPMLLPGVNDPYKPRLVITPGASATSEAVGKYTQTGNSIRVEFSDAVMNITFKDNILTGETVFKDTSKGKEKWVMQKLSNNSSLRESTEISSNEPTTPKSLKTLSKQVVEKYNPMKFTSDTVSGELLGADGEKYFYFIAVPGELTITLTVEADAKSSFNSVMATLFDPNETSAYSPYKMLGYVTTITNYGRTTQSTQKITLSEKMPVLLQLKARNLGTGRYKVQLEGAYEME